jgi:hypothetical protein
VIKMLTATLDYDIYCGRVLDGLLNFDKKAFHEAFDMHLFNDLNMFDALEVAQAGHLIGINPWAAGVAYLGHHTTYADLLQTKGYEVCSALAPYLDAKKATLELIGKVEWFPAYCQKKHFFKVGDRVKPRIRVKPQHQ